jgi:oxygen-independent coproporphyrinogen-3 oxidase
MFYLFENQLCIFVYMAGIYIHIPFCKQKCSYCDFHFSTTYHTYKNEMINCLTKEIELQIPYLKNQTIETIYFGGGTPSLLSFSELNSILKAIRLNYSVDSSAEITLEANPDDINRESLNEWKSAGINRLSIGLQSFRKEDLIWMNRAHSSQEALNCVKLAKEAGFNNISVDLIYGLPNFTLDDWKKNIQTVISFGIQHVSAYCLTVEEKTVLSKWVEQKKIVPANEDDQSDQFETLLSELENAGIEQYEISNFSIPEFHSKHNSNYWKGKHYLGIGPSAHSFNGISRSWNVSNNKEYIKKIKEQGIWFETEKLSVKDQFNELILIGLRTSVGVNIEQLKLIQIPSGEFWNKIETMNKSGWMIVSSNSISLTKIGKLKADFIASELFLD